jgi:hypothetical protein
MAGNNPNVLSNCSSSICTGQEKLERNFHWWALHGEGREGVKIGTTVRFSEI